MKAIVLKKYADPEGLQLEEVDKPVVSGGKVLVQIRATSINDWDWNMDRGSPFYIRLLCGLFTPKVHIPGVDIAGQVEAVGSGVTKFQPGDEVFGDLSGCGFGGFAEYVCVPENALVHKPVSMSFTEAAALPHAATLARQGLIDLGRLKAGQRLLINGAGGGVGTIGVQIARSLGVTDITGVDSSDKFETMLAAGFTEVIDYKKEDFTGNGQQYDLILDTKTNRSISDYSRVLNPEGSYVTVGGSTGPLFRLFIRSFFENRSGGKKYHVLGLRTNKDLDLIGSLYEAGMLKPVIDGPYVLTDIPRAMHYFGEGRHLGKVIITVEQG